MEKKPKLDIRGTHPNAQNAQLLASCGIPMLDELIGGGVPVGTIILVEEDTYGSHAKTMLKYFLAEGVVSCHGSIVASLDCDPKDDLMYQLPASNDVDTDVAMEQKKAAEDSKMTIAFRYQHLPTEEKTVKSRFGNYYDLSQHMTQEQVDITDVHYFTGREKPGDELQLFESDCMNALIRKIATVVQDERYSLDGKFEVKNVLRLCIHKLGSPHWTSEEDLDEVKKFIYYVKCLMRKSFGIAMISIPTYLSEKLKNIYTHRLTHISDIAVGLQAFAGTKLEKNKCLSEFHGFFFITKLAAINSLTSRHPGSVEYVFKQKRKKFAIEKLHLPPDIQEINNELEKSKTPSLGCGSNSKHLLEF